MKRYISSLIDAVRTHYYRVDVSLNVSKGSVIKEDTKISTMLTTDRVTSSAVAVTPTSLSEKASLSAVEKIKRLLNRRKEGAAKETNTVKIKTVVDIIVGKLNSLLKINRDILRMTEATELTPDELINFLSTHIAEQSDAYSELIRDVKQSGKTLVRKHDEPQATLIKKSKSSAFMSGDLSGGDQTPSHHKNFSRSSIQPLNLAMETPAQFSTWPLTNKMEYDCLLGCFTHLRYPCYMHHLPMRRALGMPAISAPHLRNKSSSPPARKCSTT